MTMAYIYILFTESAVFLWATASYSALPI